MKEAVLLVGHGSRAVEANEAMEKIAGMLKEKGDFAIVEVGYMELNPPTIPDGAKACVEKGAERIVVLPYFLHMGMHVQRDLPRIVQLCRDRHPGVEIVMGRHIGFEPAIADILLERYREAIQPGFAAPHRGEVAIRPDAIPHDHGHDHHHHDHDHHHHRHDNDHDPHPHPHPRHHHNGHGNGEPANHPLDCSCGCRVS